MKSLDARIAKLEEERLPGTSFVFVTRLREETREQARVRGLRERKLAPNELLIIAEEHDERL